jgi:hypothetical protein
MAVHKQEAVTASFHFFLRETLDSDTKSRTEQPILASEFDELFNNLKNKKELDLETENDKNKLRFSKDIPIFNLNRINDNLFSGQYKNPYWGHSFENTDKGKIDSDSINLRFFYFICYLSEDGKIYVGNQYLGNYGGFTNLKFCLLNNINNRKGIISKTLRIDSYYLKNAIPKEVQVTFKRKSDKINEGNYITQSGTVVFKNSEDKENFQNHVKKRFLSIFSLNSDAKTIRKSISETISESGLIEIDDDEIIDCSVVATINGKSKTINIVQGRDFATKFTLNVSINNDGHPIESETIESMINVLKNEILSRQ